MEEKIYNITQNHHILNSLFFNHDRNPAHHSAVHTSLILLSLASEKGFHDEVCEKKDTENEYLDKKLEIIGHDVLNREGSVIAPGILLQSLADNHIPSNMIITKVETRFAYPLLVPVDKGSKELEVQISKQEDLPRIKYTIKFYATNMYDNKIIKEKNGEKIQVPITEMEVTAFSNNISTEEIYEKFTKEHFEKLGKAKKEQIYDLSHDTYISADDDDCYWRSIQNKNPFKRNESISQLELLAKIPRILSMVADKLENEPPENYKVLERNLNPFLEYTLKEKNYERNNGKNVEERAKELSKKLRTTYARQIIVFDPRIKIDIDQHFDLTAQLLGKIRRGMHTFISEATIENKTLFIDESKIIGSPLLTDRVIKYLNKINYSVEELELFRYNKSF
ncbi:hypothetical protein KY342_01660 [Candidatus Woesearchaeota archaeon]|nr:hypothetical protein [Candidatus Woesearchaeota archaeon]